MIEKLKQFPIFEHLSHTNLNTLVSAFQTHDFHPGEIIIAEGDTTRQMYVLLEGEVGVLKAVPLQSTEPITQTPSADHQLVTLTTGDIFGEMAFVDASHGRSASIKAQTSVRVLSIEREAFDTFEQQHPQAAYSFMLHLTQHIGNRLRHLTETTVVSLERELEHTRTRAAMGKFFGYVVILLFGYNLTLRITSELSQVIFYANLVNLVIISVFGLSLVVMIRQSGHRLAHYGVTLKGWQHSVLESTIWTLGVMGVLTLAKWMWIQTVPGYAHVPLLYPYQSTSFMATAGVYGMYALFAPVQEFIARGAIQTSVERFYTGKGKTLTAIVVSNLLFCSAHVHLTAWLTPAIFIPGLLWGYLYARQRTLVGVSLSHILIGIYGIFILNFGHLARVSP